MGRQWTGDGNVEASAAETMPADPDPVPAPAEHLEALRDLLAVIRRLRGPGGCPWDREQTRATMAPHLLEECYEALEAVEQRDDGAQCEELGDVLMNVFMLAQIGSEEGAFDAGDVARGITEKLVRRHPHVFGDSTADTPREVLEQWEAIKRREKGDGEASRSVLAGVPAALPALLQGLRVGEKAARVGFDWPDPSGPRAKVDEELAELDDALATGDVDRIQDELGDVLFALVSVARHAGVHPELALRGTLTKFRQRFAEVEAAFGDRLERTPLEEMEAVWQRAKRRDGSPG